ncbi:MULTISPECIES: hypothetical protein [Actinomycetes]|uniref:Uncharacterized protein n=1 Tax=Streptomyces noursei TaxID=1971 RepID=A0A2N8P417_STRNR|nr:hypothetical protein [Streptomyces noursei]PNE35768.1 hypothetical protein AOB60_43040 [Streptomyces noursei]
MDDTTKAALQAFYRLWKVTQAAAGDPHHPAAEESLSNAAHDANTKLRAAGLLGDEQRLVRLMRDAFPDYDPTV